MLLAVVVGCLSVVAVVLSAPAAASADPYPPTSGCAVSGDQRVTGGQTLTITGSGFAGNSSVHLAIEPGGISLGNVTTGGDGTFRESVVIPGSISGDEHSITATGAGDLTCSFNPFAPGAAAANAHRGDGGGAAASGTASTGFQAATASVLAVVLLGGGLLFVLLGRRRHD
jgi:hypothetical protein